MTFVYDARTGLEVLDRDQCLQLVQTQHVGRVAIVDGGHPLVFPVNFLLDGDDVIFRTGQGTKLGAADRSPACFEADHVDADTRSGWSVMINGRLEEVTRHDASTLERIKSLGVEPWAEGPKEHWMRVSARTVTGRRIHPHE